ncbi:MAG TPA: hypothetical protein VGP72_00210 [Planctomycetota bacterium]|jgi:hypothetical protein
MNNEPVPRSERLAYSARLLLLGAIATVATLIFVAPRNEGIPLGIGKAHAEGSVCAAPGYLMLTMSVGAASRLYVNDTNKQVLCVYEVTGDKLRLWSARKYDFDETIFDASIQGAGGKTPEGGNGITREEAKAYGEYINKAFEKFKTQHKLP